MKNFKVPFSLTLITTLQKTVSTGIVSLLVVILTGTTLYAQMNKRTYQADYDAKPIKFGYFIGVPYTNLNVKFNSYFVNQSDYIAMTSPATMGLKLGGLANVYINDYFDFRILPTVALYNRKLAYRYLDAAEPDPDKKLKERSEERQSAWFELPIMLKYKSERRGNVRMYIFGGFRFALETNPVKRKNSQQFNAKTSDLCIEYGTGLEIFREYFKFAPELHFSHGLVNLVNPANSTGTAMQGVNRLTTHTVTLYLLFE